MLSKSPEICFAEAFFATRSGHGLQQGKESKFCTNKRYAYVAWQFMFRRLAGLYPLNRLFKLSNDHVQCLGEHFCLGLSEQFGREEIRFQTVKKEQIENKNRRQGRELDEIPIHFWWTHFGLKMVITLLRMRPSCDPRLQFRIAILQHHTSRPAPVRRRLLMGRLPWAGKESRPPNKQGADSPPAHCLFGDRR